MDIAAVAASWSLVPRRPGTRGSTIAMQVSFPRSTTEAVIAKQNLSRELAINRIRDALRKSGLETQL